MSCDCHVIVMSCIFQVRQICLVGKLLLCLGAWCSLWAEGFKVDRLTYGESISIYSVYL